MAEKPNDEETNLRRRLIGWFFFPLALFPLLALLTYNWRDISDLCVPPNVPPSNLIGVAGACFAYWGYALFGLAVWLVPLLCLYLGVLLSLGRRLHAGRRALGLFLAAFAATCLLQLVGSAPGIRSILHAVNAEPNAGGAVGYLVMTCGLAPLISPFGASVLMFTLLAASLLMVVDVRTLVGAVARLCSWIFEKHEPTEEERRAAEEREKAEAERRAALEFARQEAQRIREAEKARIAAEKEAARAEKEAAREAARAEKEAAREAARAEKEAVRRAPDAALAAPSAASAAPDAPPTTDKGPYMLPPESLLNPPQSSTAEHGDLELTTQKLISTLDQFGIPTTLAYTVAGPVVTQYALTPAPTVKVEKIPALAGNLQMTLEAKSLRILAPIPGKNAVGIEVPNVKPCGVNFGDVIRGETWRAARGKFQIPLLLGKDAAGNDLVADLASLPHLLVAGATGQGKSVCLNSMINGLLTCRTPEQLRLIMVDPKRVEFTSYNRLPHLLVPVVNDTGKVVFALKWAVVEMDKRLKMFNRAGSRNIVDFNARKTTTQPDLFGGEPEPANDLPAHLPYIVIIIDEVADVMQTAKKEVEPVIARLAALARATGIHLILATQRPDAKIITGVIKSNIPGRIAFKTSSSIDSRTILDDTGSESLIGRGDMLYRTKEGLLVRAQGAYISDPEIARIVDFISEHADVQFDESFNARLAKVKEANAEDILNDEEDEPAPSEGPSTVVTASGGVAPPGMTGSKEEQLYNQALEVVRTTRRASTSHLQRKMGIGYNHAARLIDLLEDRGVIGPARGAGPREVLVDLDAPEFLPPAADAPADAETSSDDDALAGGVNPV